MLRPGLLYFAYGYNLDRERLASVIGAEVAPSWPARVEGWRVTFNLAEDAGARHRVANLVEEPGCVTYGALYRIPHTALSELDAFESVPEVYRRATLWVEPLGRRARQAALTYLGQPARVVDGGRPAHDYLATLLRGAQMSGLPAAYVDWLGDAARGEADGCFSEPSA